MAALRRILLLALLCLLVTSATADGKKKKEKGKGKGKKSVVTYDGRSLIINGSRELIFSGSIHYPRSPPEMWPEIIEKAKKGGLNLIQTYVFWNIHEPVQGQFNFEGNYDLIKFLKMIGEHGLWVSLRVGPYIEGEWNMGGFPYWLREVPDITFRSYNEPFVYHMQKYTERIVNMVKKEKLFADQGGPVIMAQIENEYNNIQLAYREAGEKYVKWAADMAVGLYDGIPWIMCKQEDAPEHVISTCNGRQCGDTFPGPNGPNKPSLWTENWTAQYRVFGDPPSQRSAEDLAFSVARFFARNGTLNNYYMYYGGTNYGRTSSSFVTTRYYDEAPLDEFGLLREPKWGHLRDLHRALRLSKKPLLWGTPSVQKINKDLEIITFENPKSNICAAFLTNNHTKAPATIQFRGVDYYLPQRSISILPDCKTVVYNTETVVAQHSARNFIPSKNGKTNKWEIFQENVPNMNDLPVKNKEPLELYSLTKDTSDYAWYCTSINFDRRDLPMRPDILPVLQIASLGHALAAFVNGIYIGFGHGNNIEKSFLFQKPISLKPGVNQISILAMTVGFPVILFVHSQHVPCRVFFDIDNKCDIFFRMKNSGAYMEKRFAGPRGITIQGLMSGTLDITMNNWGHQVGMAGEKMQLYTEEGSQKVKWGPTSSNGADGPLSWYKTYFDAPEGNDPVAINMNSMAKGMIWVNGKSIGRYWTSFLSPLGKPTQSEYHIPRAFLKPKNNLLVIFEETGGKPEKIEIQTVNRNIICSVITEYHPPLVKSWERKDNIFRAIVDPVKTGSHLSCPDNKVMNAIEFASFGDADGACGYFYHGKCNSPKALQVVEQYCLGKNECTIPIERQLLDDPSKDSCPEIAKTLVIQAECGHPEKKNN
ncbi:beta-galactosidase 13-like [Olea europaea subsp. europaea]|uniref:Beta-galactosidase n=1 Tax=Olea europaea subsp. europaea TaxID=158383 RepID=A0A8S0SK04_OLEEU|nr:beta-galactosidase 13-like [Olea europaea subsp. europaea]